MKLWTFLALIALPSVFFGWRSVQRQTREPKNLVASHLVGEWTLSSELSAQLGAPAKGGFGDAVEFREDESVVKKVPAEFSAFLKEHGMYFSGVMILKGKDFPFVLTAAAGSPYVLYFVEKSGNPMGDQESFFVSLAAGKTRQQDLLFIGGDFDNQAFQAYSRSKP